MPKNDTKSILLFCKGVLVELSMLLKEFYNAKYIWLLCQVLILHLQGAILHLERLKLMATEIHHIREGASKAHHVAT
jgi:hypothetical protein